MTAEQMRKARISREVKELLENEYLQQAFKDVREMYVKQWEESDTQGKREAAWHGLQSLSETQRMLRQYIARGAKEALELNREQ